MQKTENSIKISDVVNSLKNTNLLSEFGNNCDFLKQSLILFYNLTSKGVKISEEEKLSILKVLDNIETVVKGAVNLEEVK